VGHTGGMPTTERAFAKLTRSLRIVGRRSDGYHLLESEMVTIDFADVLEFTVSEAPSLSVIDEIGWEVDRSGGPVAPESPTVPVDGSNLVMRALALGRASAEVTLRKRIPAGGGLGGGSADAAAALRFAGVTDPLLAVGLGADVPFCLSGGRAIVRGIGEEITPLPTVALAFVVITPSFGVSTVDAYRAFDELGAGDGLNDLERAAFAVEPRLVRIRDLIAGVAGERPMLAGSGSSFFVECPGDTATALRSGIADAARAEGIVASVVGCASTGPHQTVMPGK
jgi:4-diphosphocytidyl-2-C-methyl-D-erythritol kinase